ncbi:hypothetical protein EJ05DRAFT_143234 [Pseudovirgaria hyperparasitica]|uniref:[histone H3]-trimethyl-L-lysine(9) demethylase n=1 Tax=Pseudovirgaria hyperparasitica TaxID=470096 RepID=A0A6A6VXC7_9PEZI|nr:uncharacterized protein EJ05DRAFT_143234 [Pseudovirgaria hyperparasitica]KAF2754489.1 hypothetical protein EJ05DRAFT_143234 [Pseudovirgaria hyperparasitica]
MAQFRSFPKFIDKVNKYGMKSGIAKVIPPQEWTGSLPDLTEMVKTIKVKNPITQEFAGQFGQYTQANIEKQRSYNLPQWKALTEEHNHQPPAKRGERRRGEPASKPRPSRSAATATTTSNADGAKRRPGRPRRGPAKDVKEEEKPAEDSLDEGSQLQVPPTPTSPESKPTPATSSAKGGKAKRIKKEEGTPTKGRQPKSISSRRMNNRRDVSDYVDEAAFEGFNYRLENVDEYTPERCAELEENYWRTLNYGSPMYGADMPGSLFDDSTTTWNVAKLENLLDVLGTKVPGVNTAYLYLGMWKATFSWHLEDMDLYSINYIHFGAPKQWYSISQADARKFENAMRSIWPNDAKNCSQFLRHKTYLISPAALEKQHGIKVNKLVHYEGEFVITYPYGYHSGYNIGYNCAESVNFATEEWLNYGRIAKKCDCEADSVWVDVAEIERKLRGEPTPEYIEMTDSEDEDDGAHDLPSPPASVSGGKSKGPPRKRKRDVKGKDGPGPKKKKLRLRIKVPSREPCILCPNDVVFDDLLPTDNGKQAHRSCALYTLETFITEPPNEKVCNVAGIDKARLDLKCNYCRSKRGSCFQCDHKKCTRAYHATCAQAAGVQIDTGNMPYFDDDGQEYFYEGTDFRCRFHRPKRQKQADSESLENNKFVANYAKGLKVKDVVQVQYLTGEVFAGTVVENRLSEGTLLIDVVPAGDRIEVEHKYLLALDPADSLRPKPSSNAKPLPDHLTNKNAELSEKSRPEGVPEKGDPFMDPNCEHKWDEFNRCEEWERNKFQAKVDFSKPEQIWHYLPKKSTEARPQYTEDPAKPRYNIRSNFLDTVKPAPAAPAYMQQKTTLFKPRQSYTASYPAGANVNALNGAMAAQRQNAPGYHVYQYAQQSQQGSGAQSVYAQSLPFTSQQQQQQHHQQQYRQQQEQQQQQQQQQSSQRAIQAKPSTYPRIDMNAPPPPHREYRAGLQQSHSPTAMSPTGSTRSLLSDRDRPSMPSVDKKDSPYQWYHQYYQPRSSEKNNYVANPYALPRRLSGQTAGQSSPSQASQSSYLPPNTTTEEYLAHLKIYPYLLNCYLRRPKAYVSPYAIGGGFTQEWQPLKVHEKANPDGHRYQAYQSPYARQPSRPGSSHTGVASNSMYPSGRPTGLLFQSPYQFQQDVARGSAIHQQQHRGIEKLAQGLNHPLPYQISGGASHGPQSYHARSSSAGQTMPWTYTSPGIAPPPPRPAQAQPPPPSSSSSSSSTTQPNNYSFKNWSSTKQQQPTTTTAAPAPAPSPSQAQPQSQTQPHEQARLQESINYATPTRPTATSPNGARTGKESPARPEYSPISDFGKKSPLKNPGGAETWRYV